MIPTCARKLRARRLRRPCDAEKSHISNKVAIVNISVDSRLRVGNVHFNFIQFPSGEKYCTRPRAQIERFEAGAQTNITRDIFRNDLSRARDNLEFLRVTVRTISQQVYERYDEDDEDLATASALGNLRI